MFVVVWVARTASVYDFGSIEWSTGVAPYWKAAVAVAKFAVLSVDLPEAELGYEIRKMIATIIAVTTWCRVMNFGPLAFDSKSFMSSMERQAEDFESVAINFVDISIIIARWQMPAQSAMFDPDLSPISYSVVWLDCDLQLDSKFSSVLLVLAKTYHHQHVLLTTVLDPDASQASSTESSFTSTLASTITTCRYSSRKRLLLHWLRPKKPLSEVKLIHLGWNCAYLRPLALCY